MITKGKSYLFTGWVSKCGESRGGLGGSWKWGSQASLRFLQLPILGDKLSTYLLG